MKRFNNFDSMDLGVAIVAVILLLALAIGLCAFEAWIAMLLWNAILVPMFAAPEMTFWPMWGLMVLCGILFKSININKKD